MPGAERRSEEQARLFSLGAPDLRVIGFPLSLRKFLLISTRESIIFGVVSTPHPGDLVVWRGHVGIAIDGRQAHLLQLCPVGAAH